MGLRARVRQAQTEMLYGRVAAPIVTGVVFALMMCVAVAPVVSKDVVWGWFVTRCCVAVLRMLQRWRFNLRAADDSTDWRRWFLVMAAIDGLFWGLGGVLLTPHDNTDVIAMILAALLGVASVGVFALQPYWRASAAFLLSLLTPVVLDQLFDRTRFGVFASIGLSMFVVLMLVEARDAEARIRELLRLRFDTDRIAEERAEALLLAQRQSSVKSQFLATMSHEMRTPLHGILGITRMLQQAPPTKSSSDELALIGRAGEHLLTLINDVLDFSKLEAGRVKLAAQPFDLAQLIDEAVSLSLPSAYQSGLMLTTRMHMPRPCPVIGDPSRIRQVLHNLIGNAVKFTGNGAVTIVAKHRNGRARIAVHDTGIGIAADDIAQIFDAFHQTDSSFARRYAGTGLGLTIARELARAMGGDLVCTSKLGRGSCFTVTLDLPAAPMDLQMVTPPPMPVGPQLSGRVLLAEDNPVNAIVAEASLRKLGLNVEVVTDGEQALAAFRKRRPDIVLLDCQMPVMDGFEAARLIREHEEANGWPRTPLLALTANALEGDREMSMAAGMDEHLAKPFREDQLNAVLLRLLGAQTATAA
jgi:signal transduction histidine kinase/CheY-like chemotaxis protein